MNQTLNIIILLITVLLFFYFPNIFFGIVLVQMIGKIIIILSTGQGWSISRKIDEVIKETTVSDVVTHSASMLVIALLIFSTGDYTITSMYVIIGLFSLLNIYIHKRLLKWE